MLGCAQDAGVRVDWWGYEHVCRVKRPGRRVAVLTTVASCVAAERISACRSSGPSLRLISLGIVTVTATVT